MKSVSRLSATVASGWLLVCGVLQSAIWNGDSAPRLIRWVGLQFEAISALTTPASEMTELPSIYFAVGRLTPVGYLLLLLALGRLGVLARRSRWLLMSALMLGTFADAGVYWFGRQLGAVARHSIFANVEVPALAVMGLLTLTIGVGAWRERRPGRGLVFAPVLMFVCTAALHYLPHGPLLGLALATTLVAWRVEDAPLKEVFVALGATVVVLAVATWLLPYRARVTHGADAQRAPMPLTPCAHLSLHVFSTGASKLVPVLAQATPWRPVAAFIVDVRGQYIAFDTGLSMVVAQRGSQATPWPMNWLIELRGAPERTFAAQAQEAGLWPLDSVILSHEHLDHTGGLDALPKLPVVRFRDVANWLPGPAPFSAHADLTGDGCVQLIDGSGHSGEDVMLLLSLPQGPVLLSGDAVVHFEWLANDDVERIARDPERAATVRNQVRQWLKDPNNTLVPGHDLSRLPQGRGDLLLHHPEWVERKN